MLSIKGCRFFASPAGNTVPFSLNEGMNLKEVLALKRAAALLLILVLCLSCCTALAKNVDCPRGGFSVTVPDHFEDGPVETGDDPDLCFYQYGKKLTVLGYATYMGEFAGSDLFEVLTGNETEYGWTTVNGMNMYYTRTDDYGTVNVTYQWMDRGNFVTLAFSWSAEDASVIDTVNRIISSISFDAGH